MSFQCAVENCLLNILEHTEKAKVEIFTAKESVAGSFQLRRDFCELLCITTVASTPQTQGWATGKKKITLTCMKSVWLYLQPNSRSAGSGSMVLVFTDGKMTPILGCDFVQNPSAHR